MKVLVADDDLTSRTLISALLAKRGYEVQQACDGNEALALLSTPDPPRLAVMDWMMPGLEGVEVIERTREGENRPYIYFILLTSKTEKAEVIEGISRGADDYITKPLSSPDELYVRVRTGRRILELQQKLETANRSLTLASRTDPLTGLLNRRAIFDDLGDLAPDKQGRYSLIIADIDRFKEINDTWGHEAGDKVLKDFAGILSGGFHGSGMIARIGGEEFLAAVFDDEPGIAAVRAEMTRLRVAEYEFKLDRKNSARITCSFGIHNPGSPPEKDLDTIFRRADKALYEAKRQGRNQVVVYTPDMEIPPPL